jgi:hypothetical protein
MNATLTLLFLLAGLVCFVLATLNLRIRALNLIALGLACWIFPSVWNAFEAI